MSPASRVTFQVFSNEDQSYLTISVPGQPMRSAGDDHPNFDAAVERLNASRVAYREGNDATGDNLGAEAYDLIDVERAVTRRFQALSDRVSVKDGNVFLDGDVVEGPLMDQIMRTLEAGGDFKPLVNFYEKLLANPLGHAREALFAWVDQHGLTITTDGDLIGYKAFNPQSDDDGNVIGYKPSRVSNNPDRVNGEEVEVGQYMIVNPGDVVETPRSLVLEQPSSACGEGLHVGNYSYNFEGYCSQKFAVKFSPRDVVNVPNNQGKVRVCRYTVLDTVTAPYTEPVVDLGTTEDADTTDTWLDGDKPTVAEIEAYGASVAADATEAALDQAAAAIRDAKGRFVAGRKSKHDPKTGRFVG